MGNMEGPHLNPQDEHHLKHDRHRTVDQVDPNLSEEQVLALFEQLVAELDSDSPKRKAG